MIYQVSYDIPYEGYTIKYFSTIEAVRNSLSDLTYKEISGVTVIEVKEVLNAKEILYND